jgi:hypothetical protein
MPHYFFTRSLQSKDVCTLGIPIQNREDLAIMRRIIATQMAFGGRQIVIQHERPGGGTHRAAAYDARDAVRYKGRLVSGLAGVKVGVLGLSSSATGGVKATI